MPKDNSKKAKDVGEQLANALGISLQHVMEVLNRVFAGEIEYDEALQEFGLFTAEVRKNYPELYKALQRGSKQAEALPFELLKEDPEWQEMSRLMRESHARLERATTEALMLPKEMLVPQRIGMNAAQIAEVPQNGSGVDSEEVYDLPFGLTEDGQRVYGYRAWVKGEMRGAQIGSEWNVRWDVEREGQLSPMPNEGGPLTVPIEGGRMRFNVVEINGTVMRLRFERMLPPKQG